MKRGDISKKETICWDCQNCTRCSWADGIPVKGWTATPTVIHDYEGYIDSFLVEKCPLFKQDDKKKVTIEEMARILGRGVNGVTRYASGKGGRIFLRSGLREKGYKLIVNEIVLKGGKTKHEFILKKLPSK